MTRRSPRQGAILILSLLVLVVLLGVLGLAVDAANLQVEKTRLQTAADAAALSGAMETSLGRSPATVTQIARNAASRNGVAPGQGTLIDITTRTPDQIEAVVVRPVPTYFLRLFRWDAVSVSARAVARVAAVPRIVE